LAVPSGHHLRHLDFGVSGFTLGLIFVTDIWGRVWCGWACPQTVFIDGVYRRIEAFFEGTAPKRKALDQAPWTFEKVRRRGLKHLSFLLVTLIITHSFLAYFVGADNVLQMVLRPPAENWTSFVFILLTSAVLYFNFAWFREQFCIIMCPYGRLQSALFDSSTTIVGYDKARNDCIKCMRCVNVCPTGIDIRDGVQLECIACTACIDACDEIMTKVNKPVGLIRYTSEDELAGVKVKKLRPRTVAYAGLLLILFSAFVFALTNRKPIGVELIKTELQTKTDPQQSSIFRYTIELTNQTFVPKKIRLNPVSQIEGQGNFEMVIATNPITLPPGKILKTDFFLKVADSTLELPPVTLMLGVDGEDLQMQVNLKQ